MGAEPPTGRKTPPNDRASVIVVAAGQSTRMGDLDKILAPILGIPLIAHTLSHFESCSLIDEIVLVLSRENLDPGREIVRERNFSKVSLVCAGGKRRQDSVLNGLKALGACQWVMVHDGARPCLDQSLLERCLAAAGETGAAVAGMPVKDTIKLVSGEHLVTSTPPRESLWAAQTPQIFRYNLLREAHHRCTETSTDDAAMVESLGHPVKMFLGSYDNLKVTTPQDLILVEAILRHR